MECVSVVGGDKGLDGIIKTAKEVQKNVVAPVITMSRKL